MEISALNDPGTVNGLQVGHRKTGTLADIPAQHLVLLDGPVTAAMSTVNAKGTVQLTPTWVTHNGEHILLNSARGRLRDRNLRARPNVTLLLVDPANPLHWLSIQGTVEKIIDEDDPQHGHLATENINMAAKLYFDVDEYPARDPRGEVRVLYYVRPDKVLTQG